MVDDRSTCAETGILSAEAVARLLLQHCTIGCDVVREPQVTTSSSKRISNDIFVARIAAD